jgi:aldehyde dehydrogenase (NAD+)
MAIGATSSLLMDLVPKYFEPEAVAAVPGHREENAALLKLAGATALPEGPSPP